MFKGLRRPTLALHAVPWRGKDMGRFVRPKTVAIDDLEFRDRLDFHKRRRPGGNPANSRVK
jgi:hypothetical protein